MLMNRNIALIGYMGVGKTTIGKALADQLDMQFKDLDELIELSEKRTIASIFSLYGEYYFRKKERLLLKSLTSSSNTLLSLGGGTPCYFNNSELLKESYTTIYLKASSHILEKRLRNESVQRPILYQKKDLKGFIENHLNERKKYYQQAKIIISVEDLSVEQICDTIIRQLA